MLAGRLSEQLFNECNAGRTALHCIKLRSICQNMGYPNGVSHIFYVGRAGTVGEHPGSEGNAAGGRCSRTRKEFQPF